MFLGKVTSAAAEKKIRALAKEHNTSNLGAVIWLVTGSVPPGRWGNKTAKKAGTAGKTAKGRTATKRPTKRQPKNTAPKGA